jgi:serine/threonine protein kinase
MNLFRKAFADNIALPGNRVLTLQKGHEWRDAYLDGLILPVLNNSLPSDWEAVKSSKHIRGWKVHTDSGTVFLKFFRSRGLKDLIPVKKNRASRAAEGGMILLNNHFSTPSIIAHGFVLRGVQVVESFLITRWIEGGLNIYFYLKKYFDPPVSNNALKRKRNFLEALGLLIGRMHRKGICHGDLRPGNILIEDLEEKLDFYFIDNERTQYFSHGIPYHLREKNLIQLNMIVKPQITFPDRLRFFKAYLVENPEFEPDAKAMMLSVMQKTKNRLSKTHPGIWENPYGKS